MAFKLERRADPDPILDAAKQISHQFDRALDDLLAKASETDRSRVPEIVSYGSAGRTAPGWEREYERQPWDEDTRRWRTPKHDLEGVEFIRAVVTNDQAKLREIADRPHNRAYQAEWDHWERADLAIGTIGSPGTGFGAVPVGF